MIGLVEGLGDAKSIPHLLAKAGKQVHVECIDMGGKSNIVRQNQGFEDTIKRQVSLGKTKFFILLDADTYFNPYTTFADESAGMQARVQSMQQDIKGMTIDLFWAKRNYESWIIGGLQPGDQFCGISRRIRAVPGDTQAAPADPKTWLMNFLHKNRYGSTMQACLTKSMSIQLGRQRNHSLRQFLDFF